MPADPEGFTPPPPWQSLEETFRELPDEPVAPIRPQATQEAEPPRRAVYTWLHMIVLVLVAFVLGMLVWLIINRDAPGPTDNAQAGGAASVGVVLDAGSQPTGPVEGAPSGGH